MEWDDIIYLCLLIFTIVSGHLFRGVVDSDKKKWISTSLGFLIVLFVSGIHIYHSILCLAVNAGLILYTSKRFCHIYSFAFSFLYLFFFRSTGYFGLKYPPLPTNMIHMIFTLKVVGIAFEVHDTYMEAKNDKKKKGLELTLLDIIHYSYCYIGVLTGPYYTYKTYVDYFRNDFYKYVDCNSATLKKLTFVPIFAIGYLVTNHYCPISYAESDEFYTERSFWFRLYYAIPAFIIFRMRVSIGLLLSEAACISAGFGAYPAITETKPGRGPTSHFDNLEKIEKNTALKAKTDFDFNTVHNLKIWYTELDPLMRSGIKHWNMTVQYWLAFIVYKRFPIKPLKTTVTFVMSAVWHGIYAGYYLCLCFAPFYLLVEDVWNKLLRKDATGTKKVVIDVFFWLTRTYSFSYLGLSFSLLSMKSSLRYYGSVYYIYHIAAVIACVLGHVLINLKDKKRKVDPASKKKE